MSDNAELRRLSGLLVELQTQLTFQEETIAVLDDTVARQAEKIESLRREWALVQERYSSLQEQLPAGASEKPPHY